MKKIPRACVIGVMAAMAAGCAVGPDFREPAAPATDAYTEKPLPPSTVAAQNTVGGEMQRFDAGRDIPGDWWALFKSDPLDRLIRAAIADSPNLAAAEATLRQAREEFAAGQGNLLFPAVDANVSATREKITGAVLGQPNLGSSIFNLYNASVNVSYTLDVFGKNRRELEGLQSQVDYQGYQLEGAYLALTSNIVTTAVREASLRAQIRATQDIIASEERLLDLTRRQQQLGAVAGLAVLAQSTQVAQSRATLPPLERELARTRHQLAVLAGRLPSDAALPEFELDALTLPQEVPVSLPSSLVRQRPDIRASEALLHRRARRSASPPPTCTRRSRCPAHSASQTTQFANLLRRALRLEHRRRAAPAVVSRRRADGAAPRGDRRLRPGRGAVPRDGAEGVPGTSPTRCARWRRCADAAGAGGGRASRVRDARSHAPAIAAGRGQLPRAARSRSASTSSHALPSCRRRPPVTRTPRRCSRRSAAAGGIVRAPPPVPRS